MQESEELYKIMQELKAVVHKWSPPSEDGNSDWVVASVLKPKPGKKVLVCGCWSNGNRWRALASWQPAGTIDATCWDDPPEDWWDDDGNVCTNPKDMWMEETVDGEQQWPLSGVTHWMKPPGFPQQQR